MLAARTPMVRGLARSATRPSIFTRNVGAMPQIAKAEGDISSVFASLSGETEQQLPVRYRELKKQLIAENADRVQASWNRLIESLKDGVEMAKVMREKMIPSVTFADLTSGKLNSKTVDTIKNRGTVVVRGVFSRSEALELKAQTRAYINANLNSTRHFKGQVFEIYWSPSQIKARGDPRMLSAQQALQRLWSGLAEQQTNTPMSYADRLRMRTPGDKSFALGPHVDGGSLERWEDPTYASCYTEILKGNWEGYNPFDARYRVDAVMDLYNSSGGCAAFREFQGWLSLSSCGPGEGTLRVNPLLKQATAYWFLRPFFSPPKHDPLSLDGWRLDLSTSRFPGSAQGRGQEMSDATHPHLQLQHSMVSAPRVEPGDFLAWHCDTIHAVDPVHNGTEDASVFYIPVVPKCGLNEEYIQKQKETFLTGYPPPDFPGGNGEEYHEGRLGIDAIKKAGGQAALTAMGF
ncbi:hypothetical protein TWF106_006390 [Orbilia oligospora]|uniref:DUF1479 domain protein n=1 Tax=Orbilia oligospora TaxID=2813651 RepID=A0A6G1MGP1_ORBOL|nr:hypothetical protein TWF788_006673 [Orbilia oligospora]KAF3228873.1 hypothetical protein TWF106_006390 [Orbilia oligospora]KAF3231580.1 hypothetical protein TWF191_005647 [Orbilia oligospora]KAF3257736.1 hypothetical protein TWF192_001023 [Orbilia oligospora]